MDFGKKQDKAEATRVAFEQLDKWLEVRVEDPTRGDAIPEDDPPYADPVDGWGGMRFDVPDRFDVDWMSSLRSAFATDDPADVYQEGGSEPATKSSGSSSSRSKSQDKQGAS